MMNKWDVFYMEFCQHVSTLSNAKRLKVGAVIVKDHNIISYGYNGTPHGFDNDCEVIEKGSMVTKKEVIHAEINAIAKASRQGYSTKESTLYCNVSPCIECAKLIIQSGITKVIYGCDYRCLEGVELLRELKIEVVRCL